MRVCQFRHFGKWTKTSAAALTAACQEEQLSILQTLRCLSNSGPPSGVRLESEESAGSLFLT